MRILCSTILCTMAVQIAANSNSGRVLNVYTYDSFAGEWGPGPLLEATFEESCNCDLKFTTAGDGAAIIARLKLEGENSDADVLMGLDQNLILSAKESDLFVEHGLGTQEISGADIEFSDDIFRAFDWGHFAFVYRKSEIENPPTSFSELASSGHSIVIQNPDSSTPGLGLVTWVKAKYEDSAQDYWKSLKDQIVAVTPGWTESYTLFLEGEADMVLSYTTSPAYHKIAEDDGDFAAAKFSDGHAIQIEVAAITKFATDIILAKEFLNFFESPQAQEIINANNWMYPVTEIELPQGFASPSDYPVIEVPASQEFIDSAKKDFMEGLR